MDALLATARRPVSDRGETLSRRTAPQLLDAPRTPKKGVVEVVSWYSTRSTPQSPKAIDGAVSAYLAKCAQIADPEVAGFGQLSPTRLKGATGQNSA
jgi:hypothetical protein